MVGYPVSIQRKFYHGSDPMKRERIAEYNHVAGLLEDYVNKRIENQKDEYHTYFYFSIAVELGLDVEIVERILSSIGADDNGFTIHKPPQVP
jgi:hypothetical protein